MMVQRTELLIYQREIRIVVLHQFLEAHAARWHILHTYPQCALALIRLQVERYIIVHLLAGHAHVLLHL